MRPRRRAATEILNNPILVGTVTLLVIIVAVYLSYIAENGLPFVPTYSVKIDVQNASELVKNADVRIGGARVGQVLGIAPEPATRDYPHPFARLTLALQKSLEPLPPDTKYQVRLASVLGGKYVEIVPGTARTGGVPDGGTFHLSSDPRRNHDIPFVDLDTAFATFGPRTQRGLRGTVGTLGDALAGRGGQLNDALVSLDRLLGPFDNLLALLASPQTQLGRFIDGAAAATNALAGVAPAFSALLSDAATTFAALQNAGGALGSTIDQLPSTEALGTAVLTNATPVLADAAAIVQGLKPAAGLLPVAARHIDELLTAAAPAFRRAPQLAVVVKRSLGAVDTLARDPAANQTFKILGGNDLATFGSSTVLGLGAILRAVAPAQFACNVAGLWVRNLASNVSEGDATAPWIRFSPILDPVETFLASKPAPDLHLNPYPLENTSQCQAGNEGYSGAQLIGNPRRRRPSWTTRRRPQASANALPAPACWGGCHEPARALEAPSPRGAPAWDASAPDRAARDPAAVSITFYAFNRGLPFVHHFSLGAVVNNSVAVRSGSPVRIAGVDVGAVSGVAPDGEATRIGFTLSDDGQPVHTDATLRIRPRVFLEGGYYLDLDPGTPSAPILHDGGTIPLAQTETPVQFYNVLSTFDAPTRSSLQGLLFSLDQGFGAYDIVTGRPLPGGGTAGLEAALPHLAPVLKDVAWVSRALHGAAPGDVPQLLSSSADVTSTLADSSSQLTDLVTSLNASSSALAASDGSLARSVTGLDATLQSAPSALTRIDRALPPVVNLAEVLYPSLRASPPLIDGVTQAVGELGAVVAPAERGRLLSALRSTFERLPGLLTQLGGAFPVAQAVTDCLRTHFTPVLKAVVPDGALSSGRPVWQDFVHFLGGLAGASQNFDANGPWIRLLAGVGTNSVSLGTLPLIGHVGGTGAPGGTPIQGARPVWAGDLTSADFQPGVPCATQKVPRLDAATGAPDTAALRTRTPSASDNARALAAPARASQEGAR